MLSKEEVLKRLLAKTVINNITGCWEIITGTSSYPKLMVYPISYRSEDCHRLSAWIIGDLDLTSSLMALHKCNNKNCWRFHPNHVYIGNRFKGLDDEARLVITESE